MKKNVIKMTMKARAVAFWLLCIGMALPSFANDFHFWAKAKATTGEGKVYISKESATPDDSLYAQESSTDDFTARTNDRNAKEYTAAVFLFAKPEPGYAFLKWIDKDGKQVSTLANTSVNLKSSSTSALTEPLNTYTAQFAPTLVTVKVDRPDLAQADMSKRANAIGDVITLTTKDINKSGSAKFLGWTKDGGTDYVSTQPSFQVTVTGPATYTAHWKLLRMLTGPGYYRLRHLWGGPLEVTGNKFEGQDLTETGNLKCNRVNSISSPGTVFHVDGNGVDYQTSAKNAVVMNNASLTAQGSSTQELTTTVFEIKACETLGYYKHVHGGTALKRLDNDHISIGWDKTDLIADQYAYFAYEPLTEEYIDQYYFGAAPNANVKVGDTYYTTLYTTFPFRCYEPDSVKAYIVTRYNSDGTVKLKEIGPRVPARTPVVLQCKGKTAKENRLIPIEESEITSEDRAALQGNLLQGKLELNHGKNDLAANRLVFDPNTMGVIGVNAEGKLVFGNQNMDHPDKDPTHLKNNCAYLPLTEQSENTFAALVEDGMTGERTIKGKNLQAVDRFTTQNGDQYLVVTDRDDSYIGNWVNVNSDVNKNAQQYPIEGNDQLAYKQCNWLIVKCANDEQYNMVGQAITSINGTVTDAVNPTMEAANIVAGAPLPEMALNTYCPVNFMTTAGSNLVHTGERAPHQGEYFFMTPKPSELAKMVYCVPSADKTAFCVPQKEVTINGHDFAGGVPINWAYNAYGDVSASLDCTAAYVFKAIVKRSVPSPAGSPAIAPKEGSISSQFVIYPLNINPNDLVTGVSDVRGSKTVTRVRYYSLQGVESDRPHEGINVVVTTYSDGSRQVTKRLR